MMTCCCACNRRNAASPPLSNVIGFAKEMNTMRLMPTTQQATTESVVTAIHHQDIVGAQTRFLATDRFCLKSAAHARRAWMVAPYATTSRNY